MPAADPRLTSPAWRRLRLLVLDRDRWVCQLCGGTATCVDHVVARADGGDMWNPANLRAACRRCNNQGGAELTNRRRAARYATTLAVYNTRM